MSASCTPTTATATANDHTRPYTTTAISPPHRVSPDLEADVSEAAFVSSQLPNSNLALEVKAMGRSQRIVVSTDVRRRVLQQRTSSSSPILAHGRPPSLLAYPNPSSSSSSSVTRAPSASTASSPNLYEARRDPSTSLTRATLAYVRRPRRRSPSSLSSHSALGHRTNEQARRKGGWCVSGYNYTG
jgi:hypothetical protein